MDLYLSLALSLPVFGIVLVIILWKKYRYKMALYNKKLSLSDKLLNAEEARFYRILCHACHSRALVLAKVSISNINAARENVFKNTVVYKRSSASHIVLDYVVCDKNTLSIIAVVSLQDSALKENRQRDKKIAAMCKKNNLPHYKYRSLDTYLKIRQDIFGK